jgi:chitinase
MKTNVAQGIIAFLLLFQLHGWTQSNNAVLVGYWHNWNDVNAPYVPLSAIDARYDIIEVSFAVSTAPTDMTMLFTPDVVSQSTFMAEMQALQNQGKKVFISVGGATSTVDLTTQQNKNAFINSMNAIIDTYGFDGLDIDIEGGNSILNTGGSISGPTNVAQQNLIDAIQQIMLHHRVNHQEKLLLSMAPETAYVQGGQSAFGGIWGGYLPVLDALRDSIDYLQVQLYNSGTMYGIDGGIYTQGTADFIVAMTEALIQGFNTAGGNFAGFPASKVLVGLPACGNAAGGGFVDAATVQQAMLYLMGMGPQAGTYVLSQSGGYPDLGGMMTWSINWDAIATCEASYQYAANFESIFQPAPNAQNELGAATTSFYPNPGKGNFNIKNFTGPMRYNVYDIRGLLIQQGIMSHAEASLQIKEAGTYWIQWEKDGELQMQQVVVW